MKLVRLYLGMLLMFVSQLVFAEDVFAPKSGIWVLRSEAQTDDEGSLLLLGVSHTYQHYDPQLDDFERMFNAFKPTLVLLEGGFWPSSSSKAEALACCGEMGFMRYLADSAQVPVGTWEGDAKQEADFVLAKVKAQDLKLYYVLRQVPQLLQNSSTPLAKQLDHLLSESSFVAKEYGLLGEPSNIKQFQTQLNQLAGEMVKLNEITSNGQFNQLLEQPQFAKLKKIRSLVDTFRDRSAIDKLNKALADKQRVMILVGKMHFRPIMQSQYE